MIGAGLKCVFGGFWEIGPRTHHDTLENSTILFTMVGSVPIEVRAPTVGDTGPKKFSLGGVFWGHGMQPGNEMTILLPKIVTFATKKCTFETIKVYF